MPMYEYACQSCGARFEVRQKFSDDPLAICPTCGGPIHRVLFPASIVFKGGGFYSTDNRHDGASATTSGGPKSETSSDIKSETKSESPATGSSSGSTSTGSESKAAASTTRE